MVYEKNIETIKSRAELVREAKNIIYANLVDSGLAEQIVLRSELAEKPFSPNFYDQIHLRFEQGEGNFAKGIWIKPQLSPSIKPQTEMRNIQPITIKLEKLFKEEAEIGQAVNLIWKDIGEEHKKALVEEAIDSRNAYYQGIIDGRVEAMKKFQIDEETMRWQTRRAQEFLENLKNLRLVFREGKVIYKFDEYAAMGVAPEE